MSKTEVARAFYGVADSRGTLREALHLILRVTDEYDYPDLALDAQCGYVDDSMDSRDVRLNYGDILHKDTQDVSVNEMISSGDDAMYLCKIDKQYVIFLAEEGNFYLFAFANRVAGILLSYEELVSGAAACKQNPIKVPLYA